MIRKLFSYSFLLILVCPFLTCKQRFAEFNKKVESITDIPTTGAIYRNNQSLNQRMQTSAIGQLLSQKNQAFKASSIKDWALVSPASVEGWRAFLADDQNEVAGILVPFSGAPGATSLKNPRIIISPTSNSKFYGRLYIGIIHRSASEQNEFEFISWNHQRGEFDFGVIHHYDDQSKRTIEFAKEEQCYACHQSRTPIFPTQLWDNATSNRVNLIAFIQKNSIDHPDLAKLVPKLKLASQKDEQARLQQVVNPDDLIENSLLNDLEFSKAKFYGFNFVDPGLKMAFDLDNSIFVSQALALAHEWLRKLPNQDDALSIAKEKNFSLVDKYSEHYKNLYAYKNPRLKNFNIVAQKDGSGNALNQSFVNDANIQGVLNYDASLLQNNFKQSIPIQYQATSSLAYVADRADWKAYFAPWVFEKAFMDTDTPYQKQFDQDLSQTTTKHPCLTCHGHDALNKPKYGNFDPMNERSWNYHLSEKLQIVQGYTNSKLLCLTKSRVDSSIAPMPPKDSDAQLLMPQSIRADYSLMLATVIERFKVQCD